ncbi:MAG: M23 family metallopeptidase [Limnobacter sp.]|nr:M23 family metallopeptidase [Limnobacter sp.]
MRGHLSRPHAVNIKKAHLLLAGAVLTGAVCAAFALGFSLSSRFADSLPFMNSLSEPEPDAYQINPLDSMAVRLADMDAQLARLNAIGLRLLRSNGISQKEITVIEPVGQGGIRQSDERPFTVDELSADLQKLQHAVERQADIFSIIDADLQMARVKRQRLPNENPLDEAISVSRFGTRIDPFTGRRSRHEGIDFIAPTGTPILAAAAGVVVSAGYHAGYGNMVDIEHSNNTVTRYGHASRLLVKKGDMVRLGQKIALVGSTGRSTGPHLHFEVRVNDVPQNPKNFWKPTACPAGPATVAALNGLLAEDREQAP